ncbi:MAG: 4-hydroxy-tetrahydrodipicolinate synthase [Frankiales bacterium]|jgi:4-hydroxy-tetrahydrodipicolinate synthase|nr:4-hydroxy-tetrahydrodipicolinate synthase [Frankiales bacterium]
MTEMRGTWFVMPTPFDDDGGLDLDSQARLVDAAIAWGVDGLTVLGVMSEVSSLTDDERDRALDVIVAAAGGRVPIAVGCSAAASRIVRERVARAAAKGAAAAMVSAPQLLRNTDALPRFYEQAFLGADIAAVVQDEPAATGVLVPVSVLARCLQAARTDVIKLEDPPTPPKITALLSTDGTLAVFGGLGGVSALSELTRGACGTMTGFAFPEVLRAVREAVEDKDHLRAGTIFDRYLPLIQFEAQPVVGVAIRKEVLRRRGVIATATTRGIAPRIDETTARELSEVLDRVGVTPAQSRLEVRT